MSFGCLWIGQFPAWSRHRFFPTSSPILIHQAGRVTAALHTPVPVVGTTLHRALALVPDALALLCDYPLEQRAWREALGTLYTLTPRIEPRRGGLAFFDPATATLDQWRSFAQSMAVSLAIAPSRAAAQLFAVQTPPGYVHVVPSANARRLVGECPVDVLGGLGVEDPLLERLSLFGLTSVADVGRLSKKHLCAQFSKEGLSLYHVVQECLHAVGTTRISFYRLPDSCCATRWIDPPTQHAQVLRDSITDLVSQAAEGLGTRGCRLLSITVEGAFLKDPQVRSASRMLRHITTDVQTLSQFADELLVSLLDDLIDIDLLRCSLEELAHPPAIQQHLFGKRPEVQQAVRLILRRYPGTLKHIQLIPAALFPEQRVTMADVA